ncbi:hypothetical protein AC1031_003867 [Aphanomyces cochlioides]|nr:hypothetical protein AC1031_003867 [Aphanomyces cochlioides]
MPSVTIGPWRYELSEVLSSDRLDALFSDAWTGSRVWNASIFLSNHLVRLHAEQSFLRNATQTSRAGRVIELGSGCGLVGLVAQDLGAANVVVTDQAEIVDLLAANLHENASSTGGTAYACEFTWGSQSFRHLLVDDSPFDYILVSDCNRSPLVSSLTRLLFDVGINPIYGVDSWRNLARSIRDLGGAHTVMIISGIERIEIFQV